MEKNISKKQAEIKAKIKERFAKIDTVKSSSIRKPKSGKGI